MALGGGTFLVQNKVLPGAYINFISVAQASATLSDRGIVTIPLAMNWGPEGKIFTVEQADFIKNSQKIFGYAYTADSGSKDTDRRKRACPLPRSACRG